MRANHATEGADIIKIYRIIIRRAAIAPLVAVILGILLLRKRIRHIAQDDNRAKPLPQHIFKHPQQR